MKKLILLSILFAALFYGCDKIEEGNYRKPKLAQADSNTYVSKVMLEDFTGHRCGNCPEASKIAEELVDLYGDRLIIVAIHAGSYALTSGSFPYNFMNASSTELDDFFRISAAGNPNGMVNRVGYSSNTHIQGKDKWGESVGTLINRTPPVGILLSNTYNETNRNLSINVDAKFLSSLTGSYKLGLYLTEDSIIQKQLDYRVHINNGIVNNYVHRHALRATINSTFGEALATNPSLDQKITKTYSFNVKSEWNSKHCSVVVFVYDAATYEIIQAEEKKIMP